MTEAYCCQQWEGAHFVRFDERLAPLTEAHKLGPEERFSLEFLEATAKTAAILREAGLPYMDWDGQKITVQATNGRWVYLATGREDAGSVVVGRWPD